MSTRAASLVRQAGAPHSPTPDLPPALRCRACRVNPSGLAAERRRLDAPDVPGLVGAGSSTLMHIRAYETRPQHAAS